MLFHEIYGCYYESVAKIIDQAIKGTLDEQIMHKIIQDTAFSESFLTIEPALKNHQWPLIYDDMHTPIKHTPNMPFTLIEKRWLKAILLDPRIRLFDVKVDGLDDVIPLYQMDDIVYFDQYHDHDDYFDPTYIKNFKIILKALHNQSSLSIYYVTGKGKRANIHGMPLQLEYSQKDDKFRLIMAYRHKKCTINISRMLEVKIKEAFHYPTDIKENEKKYFVMELIDERNALERVMLHFAHFEKEAKRLDENHYQIKVFYDGEDESELLIRILSFGPFVKVIEPDHFIKQIKNRLLAQKALSIK